MTIAGDDFGEFFRTATGLPQPAPYDYQRRLAGDRNADGAILDGPRSLAINVPTGVGNRAANGYD